MLLKIVFLYIKEIVLMECMYRNNVNIKHDWLKIVLLIDAFVSLNIFEASVELNVNNHELNTIANLRSRYVCCLFHL